MMVTQRKIMRAYKVILQSDSTAPSHYANIVTELLNERFRGKWIGSGWGRLPSVTERPPEISDLSCCEMMLWKLITKDVA